MTKPSRLTCLQFTIAAVLFAIALSIFARYNNRAQIAPGVPPIRTVATGIIASPLQIQGVQVLTASYNIITTVATRGDSVTVPPVSPTREIYIWNEGANAVQVFPNADAGGASLAGFALNTSVLLEPGEYLSLIGIDDTTWGLAGISARAGWTDVPFSAGDFTANGSMTWTVEAGDIIAYRYMIVGRTMFLTYNISSTTIGGSADNSLQLAIPGGYVADGSTWAVAQLAVSGVGEQSRLDVLDSATFVRIRPMVDADDWNTGTNNTRVQGQFFFSIAVP